MPSLQATGVVNLFTSRVMAPLTLVPRICRPYCQCVSSSRPASTSFPSSVLLPSDNFLSSTHTTWILERGALYCLWFKNFLRLLRLFKKLYCIILLHCWNDLYSFLIRYLERPLECKQQSMNQWTSVANQSRWFSNAPTMIINQCYYILQRWWHHSVIKRSENE